MQIDLMAKGKCEQSEYALHTHDMLRFNRCRQAWDWSSAFRQHLQPKMDRITPSGPLWFGSGGHYAMEDFHGYGRFDSTVEAFQAYIDAHEFEERPDNWEELAQTGLGIFEYYEQWRPKWEQWETVWLDGQPLVEVAFSLVLEKLCHWRLPDGSISMTEVPGAEYIEVVFHGKFDRVVQTPDGKWWLLDWKFVKAFDTAKLPLDVQIDNYVWAAEQWFQRPIEGLIYVQLSKTPPKPARTTTKGISTDARQVTTAALYSQALVDAYGTVDKVPEANKIFLQDLRAAEAACVNGDRFIRYDFEERNADAKQHAYDRIIAMGREMINPATSVWTSPTKDCSWDCNFRAMCMAKHDGANWQALLDNYEIRHETMHDEEPLWMTRLYMKYPDKFPEHAHKFNAPAVTYETFMGGNNE